MPEIFAGVEIVRFPPRHAGVIGFTDFRKAYVCSGLSEKDEHIVIKHEVAHIYLQHLMRGTRLRKSDANFDQRRWMIAADLEIAANIYTGEDAEHMGSGFSSLHVGIRKEDAEKFPGLKYAEEFYFALSSAPDQFTSFDVDASIAAAAAVEGIDGADAEEAGSGADAGDDAGDDEAGSGGDAGDDAGDDEAGSGSDAGDEADADAEEAGSGASKDVHGDLEDGAGMDSIRGVIDQKVRELVEAARSRAERSAAYAKNNACRVDTRREVSLASWLDANVGRAAIIRNRSYRRPCRIEAGDLILKGRCSTTKAPKLLIYVDRSGSFDAAKTASAEMALKILIRKYRANLETDTYFFSDYVSCRDGVPAGGTNYDAVWDSICTHAPECAIVITDDDPCDPLPNPPRPIQVAVLGIHVTKSKFAEMAGAKFFPFSGKEFGPHPASLGDLNTHG